MYDSLVRKTIAKPSNFTILLTLFFEQREFFVYFIESP